MKKLLLLAFLILAFAHMVMAADFSSWTYKLKIRFQGYDPPGGGETLTNFPALVVLSKDVTGFSYAQFASSTGEDLRFAASNETDELNYEIETWNTNGSSYVWVQVQTIPSSNEYIWAYWGTNGVSAPPYTTNGATWTENFQGVWHLEETPSHNETHYDSTSNHLDGTFINASANSDSDAAGIIGGADHLYGGSDYIEVTAHANPTSAITVGGWMKSDTLIWNNYANLTGKRNAYMFYGQPGEKRFQWSTWGPAGVDYTPSPYFDIREWHYYIGTYDGSAKRLYIDGVEVNNVITSGTIDLDAGVMCIGQDDGYTTRGFDGFVDEVRISSIARSSNWIWSCYMIMASNSTFNSYGTVQSDIPIVLNNDGATNILATSATLTADLICTGATPTEVRIYWGPSDGKTNIGSWLSVTNLGNRSEGPISVNLTNLTADTLYYYRSYATNSSGVSWADISKPFATSRLWVEATDAAASEDNDTGTITVYRPNAGTNLPLTVSYALSGTASNGIDYSTLSGSITIPVGATNATIAVSPIDDGVINEGNETVTVTLQYAGLYDITSPSNAAVTIGDNDPLLDGWRYKMKVRFWGYDPPGADETLTNFPLLVVLSTNISGFSYSQFKSAIGDDLRFANSDGTAYLFHEIEQWNTNGNSQIWVQALTLSGTNDFIWAYWGKSDASAPAYTTNGATWWEGYGGVWHLSESPTNNGTHFDSTSNRNDGTFIDSDGDSDADVAGQIDGADHLNGDADYINVDHHASISPIEAITVEAWVKSDTTNWNDYGCPVSKRSAYILIPSPDSKAVSWSIWSSGTGYGASFTPSFDITNWHYYVGSYDGFTVRLYMDSVEVDSFAHIGEIDSDTGVLNIGRDDGYPTRCLDGWLDEVRVSTVARSSNWVWACWMNQASNDVFSSYGTVKPLRRGTAFLVL